MERFGIGIAPEIFPKNAIQYLLKNAPEEKLFNSLELGPAIIYLGWPKLKPWIDTRLEVYGAKRLEEYRALLQDESLWRAFIKKNPIKVVLIDHIQKDSLRLITWLSSDPEWALSYFDEIAVVFLRTSQRVTPVRQGSHLKPLSFYSYIRKWLSWLPDEEVFPYESIYLGRFYIALGNENEARKQYLKALSIRPQWVEGWINLAFIEEKKGNHSRAIPLLKEAIKYEEGSYQAHFNLGNVHLRLEQYREAIDEFKKAIKINASIQAKHNLRAAEERLRDSNEATSDIQRGLSGKGQLEERSWEDVDVYQN